MKPARYRYCIFTHEVIRLACYFRIRDEVRDARRIPDSEDGCLTAACAYLCCLPCAYYQEAREIADYKKPENTENTQTQQPVARSPAQVVPTTMEIKVVQDGPKIERK